MKKNIFNVLIVEDEIPARDFMVDLVLSRKELHLRGIAKNGEEALQRLQRESYDLVFLDIHLPVYSGIEILESLENIPQIIFTTAYNDYAINAFELNAVDYLVKPFPEKRFHGAVEKFLEIKGSSGTDLQKKMQKKNFSFRNQGKQFIVPHDKIIYLTANGKNTIIHTHDEDYEITRLLKQIESNLPQDLFCRIHKKHIVNLKYLSNIEYLLGGQYMLYLNDPDDTNLPMGRIYAEKLSKILDKM